MLLHIGYTKTGTTTLQRHVFPKLGTYIGKDGESWDAVQTTTIDLLLGLRPSVVLPEAQICSYEVMLCPGAIPTLAANTARAFPKVEKLLITIRRQDDMVWSRYMQDMKRVAALKLEPYALQQALTQDMRSCPFPACTLDCKCGAIKKIPLPFFEYEGVRAAYAQHFDVVLLPLELLQDEPQEFVDHLCEFSGFSKIEIDKLPRENAIQSKDKEGHQKLLSEILETFKAYNRNIECPVDLGRWGYV